MQLLSTSMSDAFYPWVSASATKSANLISGSLRPNLLIRPHHLGSQAVERLQRIYLDDKLAHSEANTSGAISLSGCRALLLTTPWISLWFSRLSCKERANQSAAMSGNTDSSYNLAAG